MSNKSEALKAQREVIQLHIDLHIRRAQGEAIAQTEFAALETRLAAAGYALQLIEQLKANKADPEQV